MKQQSMKEQIDDLSVKSGKSFFADLATDSYKKSHFNVKYMNVKYMNVKYVNVKYIKMKEAAPIKVNINLFEEAVKPEEPVEPVEPEQSEVPETDEDLRTECGKVKGEVLVIF